MPELFSNGAQTTLAAAISSTSSTSISVSSVGTPSTPGGFPATGNFRILIDSEFLLVTSVSGSTFTVERGIEGSAPATHSSGAQVTQIVTAGALAALVEAGTGITGVQIAGIALPAEGIINFASGFSGADDPTNGRTNITATGGGGGGGGPTVVGVTASGALAPTAGAWTVYRVNLASGSLSVSLPSSGLTETTRVSFVLSGPIPTGNTLTITSAGYPMLIPQGANAGTLQNTFLHQYPGATFDFMLLNDPTDGLSFY